MKARVILWFRSLSISLKKSQNQRFFMLPGCIEKDQRHDLRYTLLKNRPSPNFWYTTNFFGHNYDRFCNFPIQKHFAKYRFKIAISIIWVFSLFNLTLTSFDYLRLDTKVSISLELRSHFWNSMLVSQYV